MDTLLRHYGSARRLQKRARAASIRQSLFDQVLQALAPDETSVLVIGGSYLGGVKSKKGTKYPSILRALLKHFEARRRVVYVDEYNTSQFCPDCDTRLVQHSNREKHCGTCDKLWNRDVVGALNQKKVFEHWLQHGERPAHLCRPAASGAHTGGSTATRGRPSKKRGAAAEDGSDEDEYQPPVPPRRRAKSAPQQAPADTGMTTPASAGAPPAATRSTRRSGLGGPPAPGQAASGTSES